MGKILSFIGGCIAGVAGVFAVAVMSEMSPTKNEETENSSIVAHEEVDIE